MHNINASFNYKIKLHTSLLEFHITIEMTIYTTKQNRKFTGNLYRKKKYIFLYVGRIISSLGKRNYCGLVKKREKCAYCTI